MSAAFTTLFKEVSGATKFLHTIEECRPQYQRILDYIHAHPDERASIASFLAEHFDIYLLLFLMPSLRWPEVRVVAEARYNDGGNHFHDSDLRELLEIYSAA
jgi:hypothetical protein